jgi:hypothetical protein
MNHNSIPSRQRRATSLLVARGLPCLALLLWLSTTAMAQTRTEAERSVVRSTIHVTHVLGFEGARHDANGELTIQGDTVQFQRDGSPAGQVSTSSILNISLGGEDLQVGGVPMMLGKAAVPFGGGRVVSLFSHKKYDTVTLEYLDSNGGFHVAIFRLNQGQGETLKEDLLANGAHIAPLVNQAAEHSGD